MLVDLIQLRTFVAVAEEQHLAHAAQRLHVSNSTASGHIRAVEESLGTPLFVRANRSLQLTRAGELLLKKARAVLGEAIELTAFARELAGQVEGRLVLGSNSDPQASRLGDIVSSLLQRHPLLRLELRYRPSQRAREGLHLGEIDVAAFLGRPSDPRLSYFEMAPVGFVVAAPAAWRDRVEHADWAGLARLPWLTPVQDAQAYPFMVAEMFGMRGLQLNTLLQFDNVALGRAMLQSGLGLMLLREEQALQGQRDGTLCIASIARAQASLLIAHLAGRAKDPLIEAFMDCARQHWPALAATSVTAGG